MLILQARCLVICKSGAKVIFDRNSTFLVPTMAVEINLYNYKSNLSVFLSSICDQSVTTKTIADTHTINLIDFTGFIGFDFLYKSDAYY